MRYRICHRTSYDYAKPVFESFNEVRLQPLACATQTLLDFDLVIQPPATVIAFRDYYGNAVHDFGVPYLHERLVIEATSDVVTHASEDEPIGGPAAGEDDLSVALAGLRDDAVLDDEFAEFLGPSSYIVLSDDSAELAARCEPTIPMRPPSPSSTARSTTCARASSTGSGRPPSTARSPRCWRAAAASARTSRTC